MGINRPYVLRCGHTFCISCLRTCMSQGDNTCPMCRTLYYADGILQMCLPSAFPAIAMAAQARVPEVLFASQPEGYQPVVYMDLEANGRSLGRVRIRLTCGPRRREQWLRLCTGQYYSSTPPYKGSKFFMVQNFRKAGECILHCGHINIAQGLEQDQCPKYIEGTVTAGCQPGTDDARFGICTTTDPSNLDRGNIVGRVVSGLKQLQQAVGQHSRREHDNYFISSEIRISDTGIDLPGL